VHYFLGYFIEMGEPAQGLVSGLTDDPFAAFFLMQIQKMAIRVASGQGSASLKRVQVIWFSEKKLWKYM